MFKQLRYHFSIIVGYTVVWHMLYYCPPVKKKFNEMIIKYHGNLIKKKE